MKPIEVIEAKKKHLARLANQGGAAGEVNAIGSMENWVPRPRGKGLKVLLAALEVEGIKIKPSSFDAISLPSAVEFENIESVLAKLNDMIFIEIKTANQLRVKDDFSGFFFALTENEIMAAEALGARHKVALFNKVSGAMQLTSVSEILLRAKSSTWQVSIQL